MSRTSRCCYGSHRQTEAREVGGELRTFGANSTTRPHGRPTWGTVPVEAPSSPELPHFEARPDEDHDRHYCGCWGWE